MGELSDYIPVSLPRPLIERADELVARAPELGFRTRSEFVTNAVRESLLVWEERAYRVTTLRSELAKKPGRELGSVEETQKTVKRKG